MSPAFQFGVILHQPSGWQDKQGSFRERPVYRAEIQNDKLINLSAGELFLIMRSVFAS